MLVLSHGEIFFDSHCTAREMKGEGMEFSEIRSPLKFQDISGEKVRTYYFPGGNIITIQNPIALYVSKSGGHRIITGEGASIYVQSGWLSFRFGPVGEEREHWRF